MTVKELITKLLDCNMNGKVKLYLPDPHTDEVAGKVEGYLFNIDNITSTPFGDTDIVFSSQWLLHDDTVQLQKIGEWIEYTREAAYNDWRKYKVFQCSNCGAGGALKSKYCPNCGLKMKEGEE